MLRPWRAVAVRSVIGLGVLLAVSACDTVDGDPSAADSTSPATASTTASVSTRSTTAAAPSDVDPCELVTGPEAAQLGLPPDPRPDTVAGDAACNWANPAMALGVYVNSRQGIDDLRTDGASRVEPRVVGAHQARLVEQPDTCRIDLALTERSSVTVSVSMPDDPTGACPLVERAAAFAEPRLTRG